MSAQSDRESADETDRADDAEIEHERSRLDELGEHIDEAANKAQVTRDQAHPEGDEKVGELIGDWSQERPREDDPSGAVDDAQTGGREE